MSHEIINKGSEYDYFSVDVVMSFFGKIVNEITPFIAKNTFDPDEAILGAIAFHGTKMLDGKSTNVYIEYTAQILPSGGITAGIIECILYDEMPDFILDRYNHIKELYQI